MSMQLRRLIVMRHAKSSWASDAATDHERPLNDRGRRDAPRIGARLQQIDWVPDLILSSDSLRTRQTYEGLIEAFGTVPVEWLPALYHGGTEELRAALAEVPDQVRTVLALGHNPGWEDALSWITGATVVMKTACAALAESDAASWSAAFTERGAWRLDEVIRPRELAG